MITEFWAPSRMHTQPALQLVDVNGDRWLALREGMRVLYEDRAGRLMHCEAAVLRGRIRRIEVALAVEATKTKLIVEIEQDDEEPTR